ncbi:MAG: hypothetical protein LBH79_05985 [Nitrososphaerota archaeon]|nr:hypothetical protein [Nitrososphaerota archaeon]
MPSINFPMPISKYQCYLQRIAFCYISFPHGSAALDQIIHGISPVK